MSESEVEGIAATVSPDAERAFVSAFGAFMRCHVERFCVEAERIELRRVERIEASLAGRRRAQREREATQDDARALSRKRYQRVYHAMMNRGLTREEAEAHADELERLETERAGAPRPPITHVTHDDE